MSIYLQRIVWIIKKQIYSKTFCHPTPHVKFHLSEVKFSQKCHFFQLVLLFFAKTFFVCSSTVSSEYISAKDCLDYKKQIYSKTFCHPTPHVKFHLSEVKFSQKCHFFQLVLLFFAKTFFVCSSTVSNEYISAKDCLDYKKTNLQ